MLETLQGKELTSGRKLFMDVWKLWSCECSFKKNQLACKVLMNCTLSTVSYKTFIHSITKGMNDKKILGGILKEENLLLGLRVA